MKKVARPHQVIDLSPGRRIWLNVLDLSGPSHAMVGFLEVDVTLARQRIAQYRSSSGETLSFTGFLIFALAQAVAENKEVQAYRKGRGQLILFDEVDVGVMVEHTAGERTDLMGHVIRDANRKTYRQIHEEIRALQSRELPPGRGMPGWLRRSMLLPWPITTLVKAGLNVMGKRDPTLLVSFSGTVGISAVGMFGKGHGGWALTPMRHSLSLLVGSIASKPAIVDQRIEPREILHLTIMFDHDIVDGAPAARFTRRLVELIERGHGL